MLSRTVRIPTLIRWVNEKGRTYEMSILPPRDSSLPPYEEEDRKPKRYVKIPTTLKFGSTLYERIAYLKGHLNSPGLWLEKTFGLSDGEKTHREKALWAILHNWYNCSLKMRVNCLIEVASVITYDGELIYDEPDFQQYPKVDVICKETTFTYYSEYDYYKCIFQDNKVCWYLGADSYLGTYTTLDEFLTHVQKQEAKPYAIVCDDGSVRMSGRKMKGLGIQVDAPKEHLERIAALLNEAASLATSFR